MWSIIIGIIVGIIVGVILSKIFKQTYLILAGVSCGLMCSFLTLVIIPPKLVKCTSKHKLINMHSGDVYSSQSYLFGSTVNDNLIYDFYYKHNGDSLIEKARVLNNQCEFAFVSDSSAYVVTTWYELDNEAFINNFTIKKIDDKQSFVFYIPKNSISNNFNLK